MAAINSCILASIIVLIFARKGFCSLLKICPQRWGHRAGWVVWLPWQRVAKWVF